MSEKNVKKLEIERETERTTRKPPLDEFMEVVCRNCSEKPEGKQTCTNTSTSLCLLAELWKEFRELKQRGEGHA
ncbi:hypothetical protein DRP05_12775 [Archaeoglobales archaeon]|nr:MAG: hypothetical protein DRO97_09720 [Archaeoglobales archaeon]RLI76530.1 MAG: hypothetical protein DRP05_12775 [Archaeoglobales archaeon]